MRRFLAVMFVTAAAPLAAQTVHHVDLRGDCDGLTPCHSTITAGVAAAASGDTVSVFPGRYTEAVEIVGREGLKIVGRVSNGRMVCEVEPRADKVELVAQLFLDQNAGLHIENLVLLDGAFFFRGSGDDSVFVGNRVRGGVHMQMCFGWTIRHNTFVGDGTAFPLQVQGDAGCRILDNSFAEGGLQLLNADNTTDSEISGNVFTRGGIAINSERVRRLRIAQNRLFAGDLAIGVREATELEVVGNVLNAGSVSFEAVTGAGNRIMHNQVFGSDGDGIAVELQDVGTGNAVTDNVSRGHADCDLNDTGFQGGAHTVEWSGNTYDTACGGVD